MDGRSNTIQFLRSLLLFLAIVVISAAIVLVERKNLGQRPITVPWKTIDSDMAVNQWSASDGTSAEVITLGGTDGNFNIHVLPSEDGRREAFYSGREIEGDIFRLMAQVVIPPDRWSGLIFRGNEEGEYYLFLVSNTAYTVEILERNANADLPREAIFPVTAIPDGVGKPHTLKVEGNGQGYRFFINNAYLNQVQDSRLHGSRVGVEIFT